MKVLYVGQNSPGTTSHTRASVLREILLDSEFDIVNTSELMDRSTYLNKSIAFKYKTGPLVWAVNRYVKGNISQHYDLIWVDKAIWLTRNTTKYLRKRTEKLVHYTPDCAFFINRSRHFDGSIEYYDHLITTKSFERKYYPEQKLIFIPQGYNPSIHKSYHKFSEKTRQVVFIGLCEPYRLKLVKFLVDHNIEVAVGGVGWSKLRNMPNVEFLGDRVFGEDYSKCISSALFSLGLLSKRFPERHTTRTFEIPACGTALISERNEEILQFFSESEAIFYDSLEEMASKVKYYQNHLAELVGLTKSGHKKVHSLEVDYESQLRNVMSRIL